MIKVIDNYLPEDKFKEITKAIHSDNFNWILTNNVNYNCKENDFFFLHMFVEFGEETYKNSLYFPTEIMRPYGKNKKIGITRAKANLFVKTNESHNKLGYHKDIEDQNDFYTLILYLEDTNGYTEFEDKSMVLSKRNRALIFNANEKHQTVTQTNTLFRTNININFKEVI